MLKSLGHEATCAENGAMALDLFRQALDEGWQYDVVLTDLWMPVMDGLQATESIRKIEQEKRLPRVGIVGFTASALLEDKQACTRAGMDAVVTKPVQINTLNQALFTFAGSGGSASS
eukprot:GABV01014260.1.p2 GENE.GABV01014260.1~~GABV01014260.1.p2  ORF type:complete len:117 (+),score=19.56 GABV01014260.1:36-386(+)